MRNRLRLAAALLIASAATVAFVSACVIGPAASPRSGSSSSDGDGPGDDEQAAAPQAVPESVPAADCPGASPAGNADGVFRAPFTAQPPGPLPFCGASDFDVQVTSRNPDTWYSLSPIEAQHAEDCGPPPASHLNTSYEGSVYLCRDHLMTSISGESGYAAIYLTPNQVFDFRDGGSITFDLSTERMSHRDWWDITITPYAENLTTPLVSDLSAGVDFQGVPANAINIATDNGEGAPVLKVIRDGKTADIQHGYQVDPPGAGIASGTNQAATRQTFKLTIANGRMKFERLASATAPALLFWDVAAVAPFTSGVVQFAHHSYVPTKDGAGVPATWHWDNLTIAPARPFTMIKADRRYVDRKGGTVTFASPAPENAYLRFSAICRVSVNGVRVDWQPAYSRWDGTLHHSPDHVADYFVPIAAGTQTVDLSFAADGFWTTGLGCIAKDFSIWSQG